MEPIAVPWGKGEKLPLQIPPAWRVVAQGDVSAPKPIQDLSAAVRRGLEEPIGAPPLHTLKDYRVLIFSPHLRRTFADRFPPVLYDDQARLFAHVERLAGSRVPEVAIFPYGGVSFPITPPRLEGHP